VKKIGIDAKDLINTTVRAEKLQSDLDELHRKFDDTSKKLNGLEKSIIALNDDVANLRRVR